MADRRSQLDPAGAASIPPPATTIPPPPPPPNGRQNHRMDEPVAGEETWTALFADREGRWMLLRGQIGQASPPHIDSAAEGFGVRRLACLGSPNDVVTRVYNHLAERFGAGRVGRAAGGSGGADVQRAMSEMLGVSQQSVSRYVRGTSQPDLKPVGWSNLVRALFAVTDAGTL